MCYTLYMYAKLYYEQPDMGDLLLYPNKANVAFGSGKECWALYS